MTETYEQKRDKAAEAHARYIDKEDGESFSMPKLRSFKSGADWGREQGRAESARFEQESLGFKETALKLAEHVTRLEAELAQKLAAEMVNEMLKCEHEPSYRILGKIHKCAKCGGQFQIEPSHV